MAQSNLLSDVIEDYIASRLNTQAPNTVRNDRRTLSKLLAVVGNIQVKSIEPSHMERFWNERARTCANSTLNTEKGTLQAFFKWARIMKRSSAGHDPVAHRRLLPVMPRERLYVDVGDFARLLDAAGDPRDRMIVGTGLYLFTRQGETGRLRFSDVEYKAKRITVTRPKTHKRDTLPMTREFTREFDRWMAHYEETQGAPKPQAWLVPAKTTSNWGGTKGGRGFTAVKGPLYRPERKLETGWRPVQKALATLEYPTLQEGGHTLRRSGARALYYRLREDGHDGAIRLVQTMLGHEHSSMTEKYIGLKGDEAARDRILLDQWMFPDEAPLEVVPDAVPLPVLSEDVPDNVVNLFGTRGA